MLDPHFAGALIGTIALLIAFIHGLRFARLAMLHWTLRRAFNAGVIADAALLGRLFGSRTEAERDALDNRNGAMLIAVAAACVGFGWLQQDPAALRLADRGRPVPAVRRRRPRCARPRGLAPQLAGCPPGWLRTIRVEPPRGRG